MQSSNSSPNPSPSPTLRSLREEALARDYERAGARIHAGEWISDNVFVALIERTTQHSDEKSRPHCSAAPHAAAGPQVAAEPRDDGTRAHAAAEPHDDGARARGGNAVGGARITLDELLPVFRDPIEWALARAEQHTQGDPLDLAALGRVRTAYQSRMARISGGGALGAAKPTLRPTDVLTVAGLFIGSIDPTFAQRASIGVRESLLDALAEMIPLGLVCAPGAPTPPAAPFGCGDHIPAARAPFGPPRVSRPGATTCCCRCGHGL